jgi:hypothetical protein
LNTISLPISLLFVDAAAIEKVAVSLQIVSGKLEM